MQGKVIERKKLQREKAPDLQRDPLESLVEY